MTRLRSDDPRDDLFKGIKYHIQAAGVDTAIHQALKKKLNACGAQYIWRPNSPDCNLIVAFPPRTFRDGPYIPSEGARLLEQCREGSSKEWTLDDICTHLARKEGDRKQTRHVVACGWVDDCIKRGECVRKERWGMWEVMRVPYEPSNYHSNTSIASTPIRFGSTAVNDTQIEEGHEQDKLTTGIAYARPDTPPLPTASVVKPSRDSTSAHQSVTATAMAPTPQSTQSNTPAKMFDILASDPYGGPPRTFHVNVADWKVRWPFENMIKQHGGICDLFKDATFIIVDPEPGVLDLGIFDRMGRYQVAVSIEWIRDSVELGAMQTFHLYKISAPTTTHIASITGPVPTTGTTGTIGPMSVGTSTADVASRKSTAISATGRADTSRPVSGPAQVLAPQPQPELSLVPSTPSTARAKSQTPKTTPKRWRPHKNDKGDYLPVKSASIQDLIQDLDRWAKRGCPRSRTTFLADLDGKKGGFHRKHLFSNNRAQILVALDRLGHDISPGSKLSGLCKNPVALSCVARDPLPSHGPNKKQRVESSISGR